MQANGNEDEETPASKDVVTKLAHWLEKEATTKDFSDMLEAGVYVP